MYGNRKYLFRNKGYCYVYTWEGVTRGQLRPIDLKSSIILSYLNHHPFNLGSPNLDQRCKRPWLKSLWFLWGNLACSSRSNWTSVIIYPILRLSTPWLLFKQGSPNLDQRCKTLCLISPFWRVIDQDLQGHNFSHYAQFHQQSKYTTNRINT